MLYQPVLEDALYSHAVDDPHVTFRRGCEVHSLVAHQDHVEVHASAPASPADFEGPAREEHRLVLRGRYVIGADGGRSFVRQWLGSDSEDLGFSELDLVLRGVSEPELLKTYQEEREPNVRAWTDLSIESGRLPCTLDPEEAERRDEAFRNGTVAPMPVIPPLTGVVRDQPGAGELGLQARVRRGDREGLFDDVVGTGFTAVSTVAQPASVLDAEHRELSERLGVRMVHVGTDESADVVDADGQYAAQLRERGWEVVLTRPDFYVFGGGALVDLPAMISELAGRLSLRTPGPPAGGRRLVRPRPGRADGRCPAGGRAYGRADERSRTRADRAGRSPRPPTGADHEGTEHMSYTSLESKIQEAGGALPMLRRASGGSVCLPDAAGVHQLA
jgi:hypothetical protein